MPAIMIFGCGRLGASVLDQLLIRFPDWDYIVCARNAERASERLNLSRYTALQWGIDARIQFVAVDLTETDRVAELIREATPEIVFNATTPFPWWRIAELPPELAELAEAVGPGMWAPLDIVLPLALTESIAVSGRTPLHVNACYPDLTNAFLAGRIGAPIVGIGNISNLIPGFQLGYAAEWGISPRDVSVRFIGHHFSSLNGPSSQTALPAKFALEITSPDRVLRIDGPSAEPFHVLMRHARRIRGEAGQAVTTGSAATVLATFMSKSAGHHHCPGALGLPGGYPVTIDVSGGVTLDLPDGVTVEQAIAMNQQAQVFDGTAEVGPGRALPSERALEAQQRILGFATPIVDHDTVQDLAHEMITALTTRYDLTLELA
jgi:hypothetical protein